MASNKIPKDIFITHSTDVVYKFASPKKQPAGRQACQSGDVMSIPLAQPANFFKERISYDFSHLETF